MKLGKPCKVSGGVTNLHDNILIFSNDETEHKQDLENVLQRCMEMGITLKLSKSTFAMNSIKWFGRTFNSNGVTADIDKIQEIVKEGRPNNIEDVRSLPKLTSTMLNFRSTTKIKVLTKK